VGVGFAKLSLLKLDKFMLRVKWYLTQLEVSIVIERSAIGLTTEKQNNTKALIMTLAGRHARKTGRPAVEKSG
jgi:hypothetical protein